MKANIIVLCRNANELEINARKRRERGNNKENIQIRHTKKTNTENVNRKRVSN